MNDAGPGPRGARDNGLRCAGYVAVGDLDPRVADALLRALREQGIAAYASPTPASRGGYLELRLPQRMTDRLYVDSTQSARARELVEREQQDAQADDAATPSSGQPDVDAAWQQLLASLQTPSVVATWPSRENVAADEPSAVPLTQLRFDTDSDDDERDELADEHFVPPPAPPFPQLRPITVVSLLAIVIGIAVIVTQVGGGAFEWLGILAIVGGGAALVWHVKDGPPTDSGWDDGAVV
jgi:hypothetical protein